MNQSSSSTYIVVVPYGKSIEEVITANAKAVAKANRKWDKMIRKLNNRR
jgi:hypothetical protein